MKKNSFFTLAISLCSILSLAQIKTVKLERKLFESQMANITADTADKALRVSSFVFNSREFQDSLRKLDFRYSNHCKNCGRGPNRKQRIAGQIVLDSIFRKSNVSLILSLQKVGKEPTEKNCYGLGATCPNTQEITSYYKNIDCDMGKDIPFSYAYGVHLSHEFIHDVGYCHTDNKDDVAEAVGWISYHFINKWCHEGRKDFLAFVN